MARRFLTHALVCMSLCGADAGTSFMVEAVNLRTVNCHSGLLCGAGKTASARGYGSEEEHWRTCNSGHPHIFLTCPAIPCVRWRKADAPPIAGIVLEQKLRPRAPLPPKTLLLVLAQPDTLAGACYCELFRVRA